MCLYVRWVVSFLLILELEKLLIRIHENGNAKHTQKYREKKKQYMVRYLSWAMVYEDKRKVHTSSLQFIILFMTGP